MTLRRWLGLGLAALLAPPLGEAGAGVMTIAVGYGGHTYRFAGSATAVAVAPAVIDADLAGSGYRFSNLGGFGDWPGDAGSTGGYLIDSGTLIRSGGRGGVLTLVIAEPGFAEPGAHLTELMSAPAASWDNATTATYQQDTATIVSPTGTTSLRTTLRSNGGILDTHHAVARATLPDDVAPYTLRLEQSVNLVQATPHPTATSIAGVVSVRDAPVAEPSPLVLLLIGAALVLGHAARRRPRPPEE